MNKKTFTLLLGIGIIAVIIYTTYQFAGSFFAPGLHINLSQASVVKEIQSLNRLETVQFTLEKIIDAGYHGNFFQNILYGDRILLIAHADVVAGFDLSKISSDDIEVDGTSLTITLPAPEIFYTALNNTMTRVYDRRTGLLALYNTNLESEARAQAEHAIRSDACAAQILATTEENGQKQIEAIFKMAGFTNVSFIIPEGTCN